MEQRAEAPRRGYLYIATSDRLQEWALRNDRLYLFKVGFAAYGARRLAFLNGRVRDRPTPVHPCLNFTDWRFVVRWSFETRRSAAEAELLIKRLFAKTFEPFDRAELVKDRPAGNGETEIYRLRRKTFPALPSLFDALRVDAATARRAFAMTDKALVDIMEGRARRFAALMTSLPGAGWDDEEFDDPEPHEIRDDGYEDRLAIFYEDADAAARADEEGWPYEDDGDSRY